MSSIVFEEQPDLAHPTIVMAFSGWNDGGEAASTAAEHLRIEWNAKRFAHLDPEEFFDFQVNRPTVTLVDGTTRNVRWPSIDFHAARAADRDVVLFIGAEPNLRWKTFAGAVVDVASHLGAERLVTLGAFLADVAHTRPVPIVGSASDRDEAERLHLAPSNYEGPTGIIGVTHDVANRAGLESVSFWAAVPHYIPVGENPKAALALVRRLADYLEVEVDTARLERTAAVWEENVTEQIRDNEALSHYLDRLEEPDATEFSPEGGTGDEIAQEIERFLQGRSPGDDQ